MRKSVPAIARGVYVIASKDSPSQNHSHGRRPRGGSSDGAHALRLLNQTFDLKISDDDLRKFAFKLGSDCAFFVTDEPMLGTGRGEVLNPVSVDLSGYTLVLVKPNVHVSTKDAYAGIVPKPPTAKIPEVLKLPVSQWKDLLVNDFEPSVFRKFPEINSIKKRLYEQGALYACMSGSGATVFWLVQPSRFTQKRFCRLRLLGWRFEVTQTQQPAF